MIRGLADDSSYLLRSWPLSLRKQAHSQPLISYPVKGNPVLISPVRSTPSPFGSLGGSLAYLSPIVSH